ncbi:hypothetical protein [Nocardia wallacei]|uniref:hypothetical protein n=1 Tax=Nocardia wallacei TaxID=480035 RepID=UPI002457C4AA|nr:hypothetical protein [Nocardia wallacei]
MGSTCEDPVPPYVLADGTAADPGRLWQVRGGGWAEPRPQCCPNGHALGPGRVLVGWQACPAVERGGHRTHACRECGVVIYTPERVPDCDHDVYGWRDRRPAQ